MAIPIYNIHFLVDRAEPSVTPTVPQKAGYYGDDGFALVQFELQNADAVAEHEFRIEIVDGNGSYDVTELLSVDVGNVISYTIPAAWTAAGVATIRLVEIEVGDDGTETAVLHYPPCRLLFEAREDGTAMGEMLPAWQAVMTSAENAIDEATNAADRANDAADRADGVGGVLDLAEQAKKAATEALDTAKEAEDLAESAKGVYVGSGTPPDGYNLQIDPNGESEGAMVHISDDLVADYEKVWEKLNEYTLLLAVVKVWDNVLVVEKFYSVVLSRAYSEKFQGNFVFSVNNSCVDAAIIAYTTAEQHELFYPSATSMFSIENIKLYGMR